MAEEELSFNPSQLKAGSKASQKSAEELSFKEPIGGTEAALRGVQSGYMFGYGPQVTAAASASGMLPTGDKVPPAYEMAGPVETMVGAGRLGLEALSPSVFGTSATERYNQVLEQEKAAREAARQQHPNLSMAGELTGSVINPVGRVGGPKAGETFTSNVVRGAVPGGVIGGIYGSSEGDTWSDKAYNAALGVLGGSTFGGLFSGVGGKFMKPPATATSAVPSAIDVANAAARQGIEVPRVVASESEPLLAMSSLVRSIPFAGKPLKEAAEGTLGQIETKAGELAAGETRGSAGIEAKQGLEQWLSKGYKKDVEAAYDAVDQHLTSDIPQTMSSTRKMMDTIQAELRSARLPVDTPAIKMIQDAATDPNGLTYQGMKILRTKLGEELQNPTVNLQGAEPELRRLYGALSDDLKNVVKLNGGDDALKAFNEANRLNTATEADRQALLKVVGLTTATKSGDAVFDNLLKMAGSKAGSDIPKLALAKRILPPDVWETVSRGSIDQLGKKNNVFDANALFSNYGQLSDQGKDILFGLTGEPMRQAMDDLSVVGSRINRLNALTPKEGGAESKIATLGEIVAGFLHPVKTGATLGAGRIFSNIMAEPASAQSISNWAKAYELLASKPSQAAADTFVNYSRALSRQIGGRYGLPDSGQLINAIVAGSETVKAANYLHNAITGQSQEGERESPSGYPSHASGGRIGHKSGGRAGVLSAASLLADLKRRKVMLANKTEQMLSLPDDAVVQALDAAKR